MKVVGLAIVFAFAMGPGRSAADPAAIYGELCAGCHGDGAQAIGPEYPALFGNQTITAGGAAYVAVKMLRGGGNMFPFCAIASDQEVVSVANYLAAANGSPQQAMTIGDVGAIRPEPNECTEGHE